MKKYTIVSDVFVPGVGKMKHTHEQEFDDDENVFGMVYEYRQYMKKLFPGCEFELRKAKRTA